MPEKKENKNNILRKQNPSETKIADFHLRARQTRSRLSIYRAKCTPLLVSPCQQTSLTAEHSSTKTILTWDVGEKSLIYLNKLIRIE